MKYSPAAGREAVTTIILALPLIFVRVVVMNVSTMISDFCRMFSGWSCWYFLMALLALDAGTSGFSGVEFAILKQVLYVM